MIGSDNFQGEEAQVVILSTVRSNAENRVGFMRTDNRINVGCRYDIGSSSSSMPLLMNLILQPRSRWILHCRKCFGHAYGSHLGQDHVRFLEMLTSSSARSKLIPTHRDVFSSKNRLAPYLEVCCSRHRSRINRIAQPSDFEDLKHCQVSCGATLNCGHVCKQP